MLPARWRGAATHLALAAVAYLPLLVRNSPGRVAADTKTYLYLDPARLLARAPSMWDPVVGMGTVTHQNIGYLFPMGPFYWGLERLGAPDWVAQRLWLGSIVFAAGAGVLALMRTFGLRGPGVVVAALAYMLSPYSLDYAARISVLLLVNKTSDALDDPVDAPLVLRLLRAKQDTSAVVDNGRINVKGELVTAPPGDVLALTSITVGVSDSLGLDQLVSAPCVSAGGTRFKCRTDVPRFTLTLKAMPQQPERFRFAFKWSRLPLTGPFLEPLTVRFADDGGPTDRVGTIVECIKTNAKITCRE